KLLLVLAACVAVAVLAKPAGTTNKPRAHGTHGTAKPLTEEQKKFLELFEAVHERYSEKRKELYDKASDDGKTSFDKI
ncbi:hypothetical protein PENTCL1PPCAC_96, partial [Pristionchus entomophagus]